MILIVGKNSSLFKQVAGVLDERFVAVSHLEVWSVDFIKFSRVYVFSWPGRKCSRFERLLVSIPAEKLVFVSTVAVYSVLFRRQWSGYPNLKLLYEDLVLSRGGRVIRYGICNRNVLRSLPGNVPFTSTDDIKLSLDVSPAKQITNFFHVVPSDYVRPSWERGLNYISRVSPAGLFWQAPLALLLKLLGSKCYGYTQDCLRAFPAEVVLGYGVLGSAYLAKRKGQPENILVVGSPEENQILTQDGFRGLRIGYAKIGLSRFWHGVSVKRIGDRYFKHVPFFVVRRKFPRSGLVAHVESLDFGVESVTLNVEGNVQGVEIVCNKLVLAAGASENCRLISQVVNAPYSLSDHEIGYVGRLDSKEAVSKGLINMKFGFCWGREVVVYDSPRPFLMEVRPFSATQMDSRKNLYNTGTLGIIGKLISKHNFSQINEAIFNKFGFGFSTPKFAIFVQVLNEDCVKGNEFGMKRARFSDEEIRELQESLFEKFSSFEGHPKPYFVDGIHLQGGGDLLTNPVQGYLAAGQLVILGSPTRMKLGPFHHTRAMIDVFDIDTTDG